MEGVYRLVIKEEWKKVKEELKDKMNILLPMTATRDTIVHLAVSSGEEEPLKSLLLKISEVPENVWRNNAGNTPLHLAATVGNLGAVKLLVEFNRDDLVVVNDSGETPLYRAARSGNLNIVNYFLDDCEDFFSRSSKNWTNKKGTPLIHAAIQSQNLDVALKLIEFDKSLLEMMDPLGNTALSVLANMPSAFYSGCSLKFFDRKIYKLIPSEDIYKYNYSNFWSFKKDGSESSIITNKNQDLEAGSNSNPPHNFWHSCLYFLGILRCLLWRFIFRGWPHWKELYEKKQQHKLALTISKMLSYIDFSWHQKELIPENSEVDSLGLVSHNEDDNKGNLDNKFFSLPTSSHNIEEINYNDCQETPFLAAVANGISEIVQQIVEVYPRAVDYVTRRERNMLHIAIGNRQDKVFAWIKKQKPIMTRLVTRIDDNGFTALHHVGVIDFHRSGTHGPALELQEELKWYERGQSEIPELYNVHLNKSSLQARKLFNNSHEQMLKNAKEWIQKTTESCSAVAVLVATLVFAAAYTVPGGLNSKTGSPILLAEPVYVVFTVMDIVALATALTSVVIFLSILTSSFNMEDFRHTLPMKLSMGFQLLFFSVASTMMVFALTIVLTMKSEETKWTVSLLYMASFFPVFIFIIIQLSLYMKLVKNIWSYRGHFFKFLPLGFFTLSSKLPSKVMRSKFV